MSASALKAKKKSRQRIHRYTSNVFSMFSQPQIQEFKEAFNMMDQNRDGFIDRDDLIEMLTSLGKNPTDQDVDNMINDAAGPINFTMFLTLFGERLNGTDPEDVIKNAFACFDRLNCGEIHEDYLRELMTTMGDRWSEEMVDELLHGAPIEKGMFNYHDFTRILKHGAKEKEDEVPASDVQPAAPSAKVEQEVPQPKTTPTEPAPPQKTPTQSGPGGLKPVHSALKKSSQASHPAQQLQVQLKPVASSLKKTGGPKK